MCRQHFFDLVCLFRITVKLLKEKEDWAIKVEGNDFFIFLLKQAAFYQLKKSFALRLQDSIQKEIIVAFRKSFVVELLAH